MSATENVINDLNIAKFILCNPQMLNPEMCIRIGQAINSAIEFCHECGQEVKWDGISRSMGNDSEAEQRHNGMRHRDDATGFMQGVQVVQ